MSLRVASLPRPLAALAPCPVHSSSCTPLHPCITLLELYTLPTGAARAGPLGPTPGRRPQGRPTPGRRLPPAGPPAGPSGSRTGFTGEYRRAQNLLFISRFLANFGALLGHQSTLWCLRLAFSDFSVYFWHSKCQFSCHKPGFLAVFLDF